MIKKSQLFTMLLIMITVLFLFVTLETVVTYSSGDNLTIGKSVLTEDRSSDYLTENPDTLTEKGYVALLAEEDSPSLPYAKLWCRFQKRTAYLASAVNQLPATLPELIIVDPSVLKNAADIALLSNYHTRGSVLIFSAVPNLDDLVNEKDLRRLLGIAKVNSLQFQVDGIEIFEGFLLGNEYIFDEMAQKLPYFTLLPGGKVYMVGYLEQQGSITNENLPPVVWRYSDGTNPVFVVNGDFCEGYTALGLYTAMLSEWNRYALYPVVNAQNMITLDYPNFSVENDEDLLSEYAMHAWQLSRDYLWQNINTIYYTASDKISLAISPQLAAGEDNINNSLISFYADQLKKYGGEMLYSASVKDAADNLEAIETLTRRLSVLAAGYGEITALYTAGIDSETLDTLLTHDCFSSVTALVGTNENLIDYRGNLMNLGFTYNAYQNSQKDRLEMISLFTALGYSSTAVDAEKLFYYSSRNETWSVIGDVWSSYHITWWKDFKSFDNLNLAETESRARRFLATDYTTAYEDGRLTVQLNHFEQEAFFILRLNEEKVVSVAGGEVRKISRGAWIVRATSALVTLDIAGEDGVAE